MSFARLEMSNLDLYYLLGLQFYCIPREIVLGEYYGLVVVTPPRPSWRLRPQILHRLRYKFKNPYRIASILYM